MWERRLGSYWFVEWPDISRYRRRGNDTILANSVDEIDLSRWHQRGSVRTYRPYQSFQILHHGKRIEYVVLEPYEHIALHV